MRFAYRWIRCLGILTVAVGVTGCAFGPKALARNHVEYNQVIKTTTEEQLLLNIVRLRYTDTPSNLAVTTIAAQYELNQNFQLTPFFVASGAQIAKTWAAVLPQIGFGGADRPTFSLTPLDDQEFTRRYFTPLPLDGLVYLAKTTWPIATVFRLYLENLNWVPNAETASGPTPTSAPTFEEFRRGVVALQMLQDRGHIVLGAEERAEAQGSPLPAASVTAGDMVEAAKNGYEYRMDEQGTKWTLIKKTQQPILFVSPRAVDSPEMADVARAFRLKPGLTRYRITQGGLTPFPSPAPGDGLISLDVETRSLLQALYFVSHGIDVPAEHAAASLVTVTRDSSGQFFDWQVIMEGLFHVHSVKSGERPLNAHVAITYKGYWFYVDETDQDTKSTFSLLMELSRMELTGKAGSRPVLTLPVTGK